MIRRKEEESHAIVQAVSRRPLTGMARIQTQANLYRICAGQRSTGTGFSPST